MAGRKESDDYLRKARKDRSGNVTVLSAILFPVLLGVAALAVDEGSLYLERRDNQSVTDLASIIGAANIDKAEEAVLTVLGDNRNVNVYLLGPNEGQHNHLEGSSGAQVRVVTGQYRPDPAIEPEDRFVAGGEPTNAVKVVFQKEGELYFAGRFMAPPRITTQAIAYAPSEAAFSVGSRLLGLDGGILNSLLGSLLGTNLSLSVMDYNALVDADVNALSFLDALAVEVGLTAGTYNDLLATNASVGQIVDALVAVTGERQANIALSVLAEAISTSSTLDLPLSHMIDLGSVGHLALGQAATGIDADIGVMDIISAAAAIANGSQQISLGTGINLPGLAEVSVKLAIGEPPQSLSWYAIGEAGTIVRTAQTRLQIIVSVLGDGALLGTSIKLPIYVELAHAEAKLNSVSCPSGRPDSARVSVDAKPGAAELWIGEIDPAKLKNFNVKPQVKTAKLVQLPLIKITGSAHTELSNLYPTTLTFDKSDIDNDVVKSVSTRNLTQSLTQSLLNELDLTVSLDLGILDLGIGISSENQLIALVTNLLGAVTAPVDALLYNVLSTLGVRVGEADVRVTGVSCGRSVLVH